MEPLRKAIREGSGAEGVKEVEEAAERLNHDLTCNAQQATSDDRSMISSWKLGKYRVRSL